jgi:predicted aminopeptidase
MAHRRISTVWTTLLGCTCLSFTTGCGSVGLDYLFGIAGGQVDVIANSIPISEALRSDSLTDEEKEKLRLIQDARRYAIDVIGLDAGDSYTVYYDTQGRAAAYNVSAAYPDRFESVTWDFPFTGTLPYIGFFEESPARTEQQRLVDAGYDTIMSPVDAFSTLGAYADPVRSSMLAREDTALVDTIVHEILHNTVWRSGDVIFNENLATFFGRTGAINYFEDREGLDSDRADFARMRYEDIDQYNEFMVALYDELDEFYQSDLTRDERVKGREAIFQAARDRFMADIHTTLNMPDQWAWIVDLPTNNAWLLANQRYNFELDRFQQVHEINGGDWSASLAVFRQAASADNWQSFLDNWLAQNSKTE